MSLPELPNLPEPAVEVDKKAADEATAIGNKQLEQQAAQGHHQRSELLKNHSVKAAIGMFWLGVSCVAVGVVVLAWHMLAPIAWHWLDAESISLLRGLLSGMVLSGAAQAFVKKYLT